MRHPTSSSVRPSSGTRRWVLLLAAAVFLGPALHALPPAHRLPLGSRLILSAFLPADPGYLPLVGTPPLRFAEPPRPPVGIRPPPLVLYAPPAPRSVEPEGSLAATVATTPAVAPPASADRKPPSVRPEDFLPYFQLDDGASGSASGGLQFTPALPASRADFRQK